MTDGVLSALGVLIQVVIIYFVYRFGKETMPEKREQESSLKYRLRITQAAVLALTVFLLLAIVHYGSVGEYISCDDPLFGGECLVETVYEATHQQKLTGATKIFLLLAGPFFYGMSRKNKLFTGL